MADPRDEGESLRGEASPGELEGDIPPRREASLLNYRTLLISAVALVVMIVAVHIVAGVIAGYFSILNPYSGAPPAAEAGPAQVPPEPRLQANPRQELQALRATEQANLSGYGWIDRQGGIVRIPIERAMELIAEQGLPVQTAAPDDTAGSEADESGFLGATPEP